MYFSNALQNEFDPNYTVEVNKSDGFEKNGVYRKTLNTIVKLNSWNTVDAML